MRKLQVLGTGCQKCKQLEMNAQQAIVEAKIEGVVEKVTDIKEIMAFGVMGTPALLIDGEVKSSGKLLTPGEIKCLLGN